MRNPFKREKNPTIAELENYYAGQRTAKRRSGPAWLMAVLSLLLTLAIVAGLYFGVRWIYRAVTDDTETETTLVNEPISPEFGDIQGNRDLNQSSSTSSSGEIPGESNNSENQNGEGTVSDEAVSTTRGSDTSSVAGTNAASELPDTGAGESLIIITSVLVATGYIAARKFQLR